eukprot:CAMPEP_0168606082 /NCGR_PEP_ID=MMETSP0420-20121227/16342_1 /TAXON_ID=498008 /ORGANISM="Pessonella sp." /LENGTH=391 /DNA_ID=CAMNT_0008645645 /DNA_START=362 /DNA_END=1533 /DNA_ORIENTATION=-
MKSFLEGSHDLVQLSNEDAAQWLSLPTETPPTPIKPAINALTEEEPLSAGVSNRRRASSGASDTPRLSPVPDLPAKRARKASARVVRALLGDDDYPVLTKARTKPRRPSKKAAVTSSPVAAVADEVPRRRRGAAEEFWITLPTTAWRAVEDRRQAARIKISKRRALNNNARLNRKSTNSVKRKRSVAIETSDDMTSVASPLAESPPPFEPSNSVSFVLPSKSAASSHASAVATSAPIVGRPPRSNFGMLGLTNRTVSDKAALDALREARNQAHALEHDPVARLLAVDTSLADALTVVNHNSTIDTTATMPVEGAPTALATYAAKHGFDNGQCRCGHASLGCDFVTALSAEAAVLRRQLHRVLELYGEARRIAGIENLKSFEQQQLQQNQQT